MLLLIVNSIYIETITVKQERLTHGIFLMTRHTPLGNAGK